MPDWPVLVGCEESQVVCSAFRKLGVEAYSCDLLPTRGNPSWHIQNDIKEVIRNGHWSCIILHPDCTAMAVSGNRWYGTGMPLNDKRVKQVRWTVDLWNLARQHSEFVALENPVSVIFKEIPATQYIQPWQFGHGEMKKTGLALHNLPPLIPTRVVEGREQRVFRMPPSETRKRDRSKTYTGIAEAMAKRWIPAISMPPVQERLAYA